MAEQSSGDRFHKTFVVDRAGITNDHPIHESNVAQVVRELKQRGLRPHGEVSLDSIEEGESGSRRHPYTAIAYSVATQQLSPPEAV